MKYIKNKWNQLVCHIKRRDLQFVISASFTLVALIGMVFIGVFLYQSYGRAAKEMMLNDTRQLVNQVEINLNNYLRSMMRISDAMYYNVIKKVDMSKDDISHELNLLYEVNKDSLVSIACFSENGELLGAVPVGNVKNNVDVTQQSWFTSAQNKMENLHFSELHVQNIFENSNGRYYWVVSLSRGVELTTEGKISGGILLVDMNFSGIRQLFTEINSQDMGYVYLINSDGEIIYHPKQNLIFSNMLKENNMVASHYEDGVYEERFQGEDRTVVVKTVGYTGWKIVSVTPADRLFQDFNRTEIMAVIIIILAVCLMIFANQFVAVRIVKPLKKLENSLKAIGVDQKPEIYIGGSSEIQHLGNTIRSMVDQLRKLTDDIVKEQEEKRKSELDALQSQINPHFLYNTLETIRMKAFKANDREVARAIKLLGKSMRYVLENTGTSFTTLSKELEHIKVYLDIQKLRFTDKFDSEIEVMEDIDPGKLLILPLLLQPVVENAILHGLEEKEKGGLIHILVRKQLGEEELLCIEVSDNGNGMTEEALAFLQSTIEEKDISRNKSIGLYNINQRIKLTYGQKYGVKIFSNIEEGTRVSLFIPINRMKETAVVTANEG